MAQQKLVEEVWAQERVLYGDLEKVDGVWHRVNDTHGVYWPDSQMAELVNRFKFHPADTDQRKLAHEQVRSVLLGAAERMMRSLPPGRELSLVITKLEEAMFWGNAAIARTEDS